jgi:hypothetical protein
MMKCLDLDGIRRLAGSPATPKNKLQFACEVLGLSQEGTKEELSERIKSRLN